MAALQAARFDEAKREFAAFLKIQPKHFGALNLMAVASMQLGHLAEAEAYLSRAIALNPSSDSTFYNHGIVLTKLERWDDACDAFSKALTINSRAPETWNGRGLARNNLGEYEAAVADFDQAISLKRDYADPHYHKGKALSLRGENEGAFTAFDQALRIKPDFAEAWLGLGHLYAQARQFDGAIAAYQTALRLDPTLKFGRAYLLYNKANVCDWDGLADDWSALLRDIRRGVPASTPFPLLATAASAADQLACARAYAAEMFSTTPAAARPVHRSSDRIRVAYLSADFRAHAVAFLIAGVFDHHDRARFETIGLSYGAEDGSEMRRRLSQAFDRFIDVRELSDRDLLALLRELDIDIAVDLAGYTDGTRIGVLATRPAPVQVTWLGYPGTTGAAFIDYLIADRFLVPDQSRQFYSEKVVYLPDTYQPNDGSRRIAEATPSRMAAGLPADGFVFCSFNNTFKITPEIFGVWARLLNDVKGSVLWLLEANDACVERLKCEAQKRGVDSRRLVFAPRVAPEEHLARHRLADLFLDTLHYNAHTTASDALWAGLPILTCAGETFAGRVAGSLLTAAGLPELITTSLDDYARLARKIAGDPSFASALRAKLAQNRQTCALFDTRRFTRHLEAGYAEMWDRCQRGDPAADITVDASA